MVQLGLSLLRLMHVPRATYGEARRALEVLLGRFPAAELEAAVSLPALPPPVAAGVPASLLERRPDLAAAELQVLAAFQEVEGALANERLIAKRLPFEVAALASSQQAVRLATVQYQAGSRDLLWVGNLQADEIAIQRAVIKTRNLQRTNRIDLHLALGGGFDASPANRVSALEPAQEESGAIP